MSDSKQDIKHFVVFSRFSSDRSFCIIGVENIKGDEIYDKAVR